MTMTRRIEALEARQIRQVLLFRWRWPAGAEITSATRGGQTLTRGSDEAVQDFKERVADWSALRPWAWIKHG